MKDQKLEDLFDKLQDWSKDFAKTTEAAIPGAKNAVESDGPLPAGCPSKASHALMQLREIENKMSEVTGIYEMISCHLLDNYGRSDE